MVTGHSSKAREFRKNGLSYVVFHMFCVFVNNGNEMLYAGRACPDFDGTETCGQAEPRLDQEVALLELKSS